MMKHAPATKSPRHPARTRPTWIASSVELGPGNQAGGPHQVQKLLLALAHTLTRISGQSTRPKTSRGVIGPRRWVQKARMRPPRYPRRREPEALRVAARVYTCIVLPMFLIVLTALVTAVLLGGLLDI